MEHVLPFYCCEMPPLPGTPPRVCVSPISDHPERFQEVRGRAEHKGSTHLVGAEGEDAIQILHELLEGGSLGGDGVPAVFHHHVPGGEGLVWFGQSSAETRNAMPAREHPSTEKVAS